MKIAVIPAAQLSPAQVDAWSQIQRGCEELASPYFRPEFTAAVASVRGDVEVGVLEEGDEILGFFPYQRGRAGVARPVGGRLSDFQGVVSRPKVALDATRLLQGCRLRAWHFDHLLVSQEPWRPYHWLVEGSPYVNLSGGFSAYLARQGRSTKNPFSHIAIKAGKLERQVGPLRFEADVRDRKVLQTLIEWKVRQYLRSGATNVFAFPWTRALLDRIFACQGDAFAGELSALYAGDQLVAAHFGMRSYGVLHMWFPSYDPRFAKYSPGLIHDLELIKAAAARGVQRVDYGKGMTGQKEYLMSAATQVAVGSMDLRLLAGPVRRQWHFLYQWARESPLRKPARVPARILYRVREWFAFR